MEPFTAKKNTSHTWLVVTVGMLKRIIKVNYARNVIDKIHEAGGVLRYDEGFDYGCPTEMMPTRQGPTLAKLQYTSRIDSTLSPCKGQINLTGADIIYLDDLDERDGDAEAYKEFIVHATRGAAEARTNRAQQRSNIVLANSIPAVGGFGGKNGQ